MNESFLLDVVMTSFVHEGGGGHRDTKEEDIHLNFDCSL